MHIHKFMKHVTLVAITETTEQLPSHSVRSFEYRVPVDFIYWYSIHQRVVLTWQGWEGAWIVVRKMATR